MALSDLLVEKLHLLFEGQRFTTSFQRRNHRVFTVLVRANRAHWCWLYLLWLLGLCVRGLLLLFVILGLLIRQGSLLVEAQSSEALILYFGFFGHQVIFILDGELLGFRK